MASTTNTTLTSSSTSSTSSQTQEKSTRPELIIRVREDKPKASEYDSIGKMLERRAATPQKTERITIKIRIPKDMQGAAWRTGTFSTSDSAGGHGQDDMTAVEWDEWKASQAKWMEGRRKNSALKKWQKRIPSKKLPKWVKQRPGI
jgi:hypothetical protein